MDEKSTWIPTWQTTGFALGSPPSGRRDANFVNPCQWYGLWMRIKGVHNHMVVALGSFVKWVNGF